MMSIYNVLNFNVLFIMIKNIAPNKLKNKWVGVFPLRCTQIREQAHLRVEHSY